MRNTIRSLAAAAVIGTAATGASAQQGQAVQWRVEDGGNGHWYATARSPSVISWAEAAEEAVARGGHLATLTLLGENQFVHSVAQAQNGWSGLFGPWLGGYAEPGSSECDPTSWRWVDGEPWQPQLAAWCSPQPDCGGETRLHYWYCTAGWNNAGESGEYGWGSVKTYMIEWSADCNNDGIVDYGQCRDGSLPDYNGNNIPDCCETGTPCEVGSYPVQWRVEDGGNGHWYNAFVQDGITWSDARSSAIDKGGDLAALSTSVECDYVFARVISRPALWNNRIGPWIGLRQLPGSIEPDGGWTWVDGNPLTEARWLTGHPSNHPPGAPPRDYAIYSAWPTAPANTWADDSNAHYYPYHWESHRSYAVEWSADCNNDGIVDYGQILAGQLADADGNGVPDVCEFPDCNGDGISDVEQVGRGELADYNSNLVPDCCEYGAPCVAGNYPVQWREADGGNGHWYMAVHPFGTVTDWEMARAYAAARGGYLVTVTSAAEQSLIERLFTGSTSCQGDLSGVFLGGRQPTGNAASANWGWITGEPWDYTNWASSEPNDFAGFAEDYLMMVTQDMRWYDIVLGGAYLPCAYSAVVEWSADCNGDGITDKGQILQGQFLDVDGNGVPDTCECAADVTDSGAVDGVDLAVVLGAWGTDGQGQFVTDIDGDGIVGGTDLAYVLSGWGPCQ